jgi:hypothetical protein
MDMHNEKGRQLIFYQIFSIACLLGLLAVNLNERAEIAKFNEAYCYNKVFGMDINDTINSGTIYDPLTAIQSRNKENFYDMCRGFFNATDINISIQNK